MSQSKNITLSLRKSQGCYGKFEIEKRKIDLAFTKLSILEHKSRFLSEITLCDVAK